MLLLNIYKCDLEFNFTVSLCQHGSSFILCDKLFPCFLFSKLTWCHHMFSELYRC
jgi:hypothetical protein